MLDRVCYAEYSLGGSIKGGFFTVIRHSENRESLPWERAPTSPM